MAEVTSGMRRVLSLPAIYELAQRAIGSVGFRETVVEEYIRPDPGARILDIGCGPGDVLAQLPDVEYLGADVSAAYIESASTRFGDRGEFIVAGVDDLDRQRVGSAPFDRVLALGVLHHISDEQADALFGLAADVLADGGRVITVDPCFHDDQHRVAHALATRDRGQAVRRPEEYRQLAVTHFREVAVAVRTDLLRVPYSHAVLTASGPA